MDCRKGGDAESEGRMQASPLHEKLGEGEPLPCWRHGRGGSRQATPRSYPRCPGRAQREAALGDAWPRSQSCHYGSLFSSSSPAKSPFQFLMTQPGGAAARLVGARGRHSPEAGWGQEPQTAVSSFLHAASASLGVVCLSAGKARGGGGDPKSPPPEQATPWHP